MTVFRTVTFTPRNGREVTCHELWYRYIPESGNWYDGTFTRWKNGLAGRYRSPGFSLALKYVLRIDRDSLKERLPFFEICALQFTALFQHGPKSPAAELIARKAFPNTR